MNTAEPTSLVMRVLERDDGAAAIEAFLRGTPVPDAEIDEWACCGRPFALVDESAPPGEGPIGIVLVGPNGADGTIEVGPLAINPALRGRGLGWHLLGALKETLRTQGARRIVASTPCDDAGRVGLYQKAGMRPPDKVGDVCWFVLDL